MIKTKWVKEWERTKKEERENHWESERTGNKSRTQKSRDLMCPSRDQFSELSIRIAFGENVKDCFEICEKILLVSSKR